MTLGNDLRYALRQLRNSPGFTLTVLATLGLCIGANTAIFTVVDAVLLKPLPYPQPERLLMVTAQVRHNGIESQEIGQTGTMWEAVRDQATALESSPFGDGASGVNLVSDGHPQYVQQQRVGAGFFHVLGIAPSIGREFDRLEDSPGGASVAILSYRLWKRVFHADKGVTGKGITLRGEPYTVVGVMPETFRTDADADLWTPLRPSRSGEGEGANYGIVARLRPGVSLMQARDQLQVVATPALASMGFSKDYLISPTLVPLQTGMTQEIRTSLLLTWGAVGIVLLIGCVNIAGLLLARSAMRNREIATRMALGGGRAVIVRQFLTESVLLALGGGALGLLLGAFGMEGLRYLKASGFDLWHPVSLDVRVFAATFFLTMITSLLFGLLPALETSRLDIRSVLLEGGRGMTAGRRQWLRHGLVLGEVALGVVLLIGAGLLIRTMTYLQGLNPGFDPNHVVAAQLSLQDARYQTPEKVNRLFTQSLERIRAIPGVESAAVALTLPYQRPLNIGTKLVEGPHAGEVFATEMVYVTPGFFETLRIKVRDGRVISSADGPRTEPVAVVSESFVRKYLRGRDPLGSHLKSGTEVRVIVGVVSDVQQHSGMGNFGPLSLEPTVYIPAAQTNGEFLKVIHTWFSPSWIVRTQAPMQSVAAKMEQAVESVDPQMPFASFRAMSELQASAIQTQRYQATLFSILAGLALLLACIGLYGLIANSVTQRTRELGIRMALGASLQDAMMNVVKPGLTLSAIGVIVGCGLALVATNLMKNLVWGVRPTDPLTFVGVSAMLLLVAAAASVLPALRLLHLDPAVTLRNE